LAIENKVLAVVVLCALSKFGLMEQHEELKRRLAAEIERARQNMRDIHAVEKHVWPELARSA
jgi:hypothetical protein